MGPSARPRDVIIANKKQDKISPMFIRYMEWYIQDTKISTPPYRQGSAWTFPTSKYKTMNFDTLFLENKDDGFYSKMKDIIDSGKYKKLLDDLYKATEKEIKEIQTAYSNLV